MKHLYLFVKKGSKGGNITMYVFLTLLSYQHFHNDKERR